MHLKAGKHESDWIAENSLVRAIAVRRQEKSEAERISITKARCSASQAIKWCATSEELYKLQAGSLECSVTCCRFVYSDWILSFQWLWTLHVCLQQSSFYPFPRSLQSRTVLSISFPTVSANGHLQMKDNHERWPFAEIFVKAVDETVQFWSDLGMVVSALT